MAHSGVVQGVIIGATLAFLTAILVMNSVIRTITQSANGWRSIRVCGRPGNGLLVRAAGEFLLTRAGWAGTVPAGTIHIVAPRRSALVIGPVFVADAADQPVAYALAREIRLIPLMP